ncbi:BMPR2 [Cordylochernes scorpioides]|uniref:DNA-directed RNA polymerase n=1 Tax=Cordylochernes scorpioides TaxID=51811 RepID=A0ABY6LR74_9ARAC|nr:BMPR2 [Cordylochernes scorpioides]
MATNMVWAESPSKAEDKPVRLGSKAQPSAEITAKDVLQINSSMNSKENENYANPPAGSQDANSAAPVDLAAIPTANAAAQVRRNWADITEEVNPEAEEGFTLVQGRKRRRGSANSPTAAAPSSNAGGSRTIRRPQPSAGSVPRAQEIRVTRAHIAEARARQASSSEEHCVYIEHSPELEPFHYLRALDRMLGGTAGVIQITKVNGHQLLGLTNRGLAERLISEGLEVEGTLLRAFPFRKRAERITVGNLPFFMADSAVINALSPYGLVTSIAPKQMKAGPYVYVDGRRDVFITLHEGITIERLPTRLDINIKGEAWPAYLSSGIRCSRCHGQGHRRAICPLLAGLANNTRMAPPTTPAGVPPPTTSAPPQRSAAQPPAPTPSNPAMEVCSAPPVARAVLHSSAPRPSPPAAPAFSMEETPPAPPPVTPAPSLRTPGSREPAAPTPDVEMSIVEETFASSTSSAKNATRVDLDAFIEKHPSVSFAGTDALGLGREEVLDLLSSRTKTQRKGPLLSPPQCDALAGLIRQILNLRPGAASNLYKVLGQVKAELRTTPAAVPPTPPLPAPRPAEPMLPTIHREELTPPPPAPTDMEENDPITEEERCAPPPPAPWLAGPIPPVPHGDTTTPAMTTPPPPLSLDRRWKMAGDLIHELSREIDLEHTFQSQVDMDDIVRAVLYPGDREPFIKRLPTRDRYILSGFINTAIWRARDGDPSMLEKYLQAFGFRYTNERNSLENGCRCHVSHLGNEPEFGRIFQGSRGDRRVVWSDFSPRRDVDSCNGAVVIREAFYIIGRTCSPGSFQLVSRTTSSPPPQRRNKSTDLDLVLLPYVYRFSTFVCVKMMNDNNDKFIPHQQTGFSIQLMSSIRMRAHSVVEIDDLNSFDAAGAPTMTGLYSPLMGPIQPKIPCEKCWLKIRWCRGHFGRIEFPKPVFNPIFIMEISRGSLQILLDFKVDDQLYSDHHPLVLTIKGQNFNEKKTKREDYNITRYRWSADGLATFKMKLEELREKNIPASDDLVYTFNQRILEAMSSAKITYSIKGGPRKSKPWFDKDCYDMKKLAKESLKKYRKTNRLEDRECYASSRKKYLALLDLKRKGFDNEKQEILRNAKDSKTFWKTIALYKSTSIIQGEISIQDWLNFYRELMTTEKNLRICNLHNVISQNDPILDSEITNADIYKEIAGLRSNKACGPDGIPNEVLKTLPDSYILLLKQLYNSVMTTGKYPAIWTNSTIHPIFKNGYKNSPSNYRETKIKEEFKQSELYQMTYKQIIRNIFQTAAKVKKICLYCNYPRTRIVKIKSQFTTVIEPDVMELHQSRKRHPYGQGTSVGRYCDHSERTDLICSMDKTPPPPQLTGCMDRSDLLHGQDITTTSVDWYCDQGVRIDLICSMDKTPPQLTERHLIFHDSRHFLIMVILKAFCRNVEAFGFRYTNERNSLENGYRCHVSHLGNEPEFGRIFQRSRGDRRVVWSDFSPRWDVDSCNWRGWASEGIDSLGSPPRRKMGSSSNCLAPPSDVYSAEGEVLCSYFHNTIVKYFNPIQAEEDAGESGNGSLTTTENPFTHKLLNGNTTERCPRTSQYCYTFWREDVATNKTTILAQDMWYTYSKSSHLLLTTMITIGGRWMDGLYRWFSTATTQLLFTVLEDSQGYSLELIIGILVFGLSILVIVGFFILRSSRAAKKSSADALNMEAPNTPPLSLEGLTIVQENIARGRYGTVSSATLGRGEMVAVKKFAHHNRQFFLNEKYIYTLSHMSHPCLLKYLGMYAVTQKKCIAHRDLSSNNILVCSTDGSCKICDLGFSICIQGSKYFMNGEEQMAENNSLADVSCLAVSILNSIFT